MAFIISDIKHKPCGHWDKASLLRILQLCVFLFSFFTAITVALCCTDVLTYVNSPSSSSNTLRRRPRDEFDFLPVTEPKQNRSPVVLVDHKLALELWSVKIIYQYAYHTLLAWRGKDSHKFSDAPELMYLSRAVVLVNPECYTAWNIRKELIESGDMTVQDELKFSALVLSKHPKSSETFSHRKWVVSRFVDNFLQSSQGSTGSSASNHDSYISMEAIDLNLDINNQPQVENGHNDFRLQPQSEYHEQMRVEFRVCQTAAEKYHCNYYAWSHRIWVIQHCHNCSIPVLLGELQSTESWLNKHISDFSGFHYRQFLLTTLGTQSENLKEQFSIQYIILVQKEFQSILDQVVTFPGHEALWNHRKFVFKTLYELYKSCNTDICQADGDQCSNTADGNMCHQKKTRLENDHHVLEQKEIDSVAKIQQKTRNLYQKKLAQRYIEWIKKAVIK